MSSDQATASNKQSVSHRCIHPADGAPVTVIQGTETGERRIREGKQTEIKSVSEGLSKSKLGGH